MSLGDFDAGGLELSNMQGSTMFESRTFIGRVIVLLTSLLQCQLLRNLITGGFKLWRNYNICYIET